MHIEIQLCGHLFAYDGLLDGSNCDSQFYLHRQFPSHELHPTVHMSVI